MQEYMFGPTVKLCSLRLSIVGYNCTIMLTNQLTILCLLCVISIFFCVKQHGFKSHLGYIVAKIRNVMMWFVLSKMILKNMVEINCTVNILRHFGFIQDKILSVSNTLVFVQDRFFLINVALKSIQRYLYKCIFTLR